MLDLIIGVALILIGALIFILQIKKYVEGFNYKDENQSLQSVQIQSYILAIALIIIGCIIISRT